MIYDGDDQYAVWYASAGCLPDSGEPETVGTFAECVAYVEAAEYDSYHDECIAEECTPFDRHMWNVHGRPQGPVPTHSLYAFSIEQWEDMGETD